VEAQEILRLHYIITMFVMWLRSSDALVLEEFGGNVFSDSQRPINTYGQTGYLRSLVFMGLKTKS